MLGRTSFRLLAAALALAAGGCTSDASSTSGGDAGALTTLSLSGQKDGCAAAAARETPGADHPFVIAVRVEDSNSAFLLRPPGYCAVTGVSTCGHLIATVAPKGGASFTITSSTFTLELPVSAAEEELDIRLELRNDAGKTVSASPLDLVWSNGQVCLPGKSVTGTSSSSGGMGGGGGASAGASSGAGSGGGMGGGASDAGADGG